MMSLFSDLTRAEARKRWSDPELTAQARETLEGVLESGAPLRFQDLRGANLDCEEGSIVGDRFHLAKRLVEEVDFSFADLSFAFSLSEIRRCRFVGAKVMRCSFGNCRLSDDTFEKAQVVAVSFHKATLERVSFRDAILKDTAKSGWDAEGVPFRDCDFRGVQAKNLELAEATMFSCHFDGAVFTHCDFRRVKFEGSAPAREQLVDCQLADNTLDGMPLGWT
jgi:uncharacterized protein YjbI with pentapeptide repeats